MGQIVRLTLEDLDDFFKALVVCFPGDIIDQQVWYDLFNDSRSFVYAIKSEEDIKASIAFYNWQCQDDYVKIISIGTHPDYRRQGYAHKLMDYALDKIQAEGMTIFRGETRKSNLKMQKIFEDYGYEIFDKVENYYDNPSETAYKYSLDTDKKGKT